MQGLVTAMIAMLERRAEDRLTLFVDHRDLAAARADTAIAPHVRLVPLWYPTRLIGVTAFLGRAADRRQVDVLLSPAFLPWRCRAARVCYMFDILFERHPEFFTALERLYARRMRSSCRRADRVLALSRATRDDLIHYGYAHASRIEVVYPGSHVARSVTARGQPPTLPSRYFLYVGRLNHRKNIPRLLRASERVLNESNTHLVLAGVRDGRVSERDLAPPPAIRDRVHFLGYVADEALPDLYRSALALVYVPLAEGFGLPVIEAMHWGLPVIGSAAPGVAEALGPAGLAVDPLAEADLAAAMRLLATDRELRQRLALEAATWAGRFTWERAAEQAFAACTAALDARGTRAS